MAKLPHVTSNIPPDLRRYLDRTREAFGELENAVASGSGGASLLNQLSGVTRELNVLLAGQYGTPPAPSGVLATGAFTSVIIEWDVPDYYGHAYAEIWAAPAPVGGGVPPLGDAVLIGQTPGAVFAHYLGNAATRWYWVRFVNVVDQKGPFNAVVGTEASTAQDPSYLLSLLSGQITESELFTSLGDRINLIDGAASLTGSVAQRIAAETSARTAAISSEQTTRSNADSALAQDITTLTSTVGGNTSAIQTEATTRADETGDLFAQYTVKVDVNGYVSGYGLASTLISGIPSSSFIVRADSFSVGTPGGTTPAPSLPFIVRTTATTINGVSVPAGVYIQEAFVANGTISNAKIGNLAVDTAKIVDASITNAKIANLAVGTANIVNAAITNAKIGSLAVGTANIADAAITNAKIGSLAVKTANIDTAAITNAKIANLAVDTAKIVDASITNAKIGSLAVGTANIADAAITNAKIGSTIQSTVFTPGSVGWKIEKGGSAEFNGVVLSRDQIIGSGTVSIPDTPCFSYSVHQLTKTFWHDTGISFAAWTAPDGSYSAAVGRNGNNGTIFNTNGAPEAERQWGWVATIVPLTRWSGAATMYLRIDLYTKNVSDANGFILDWKVKRVT